MGAGRLALAACAAALVVLGCGRAEPAPAPADPAEARMSPPPFEIPREADAWRSTLVREARREWGAEAPTDTLAAQIHQESRWRAGARSRFASGIAQFTPGTAADVQKLRGMEELCGDPAGCPTDPRWAIRAMVRYDRGLWSGYGWAADPLERLASMLVAYNGGGGNLNRERAACYNDDRGCDPGRWFGNIERHCLRADWACRESRGYPRLILFTFGPVYRAWLAR